MTRRTAVGLLAAIGARAEAAPLRLAVIGSGNRGRSLLATALRIQGVECTAVCDIDPEAAAHGAKIVSDAGAKSPVQITGGPVDYRRVLDRKDVDAVLVASPEFLHAPMSVDALEAGKAVLSEVAAMTTLEDGWRLVKTVERTGGFYMMAENVCYYRRNLAVLEMVKRGLFGELTSADCGYVHEVRALHFKPDGSRTWRGEMVSQFPNWYPTHALGPVAQWMGVHQTDRLKTLVTMTSPSKALAEYAKARFGLSSAAAKIETPGDTSLTLIRTALGRMIELRFDVVSPKPHPSTTYFSLQGTRGAYRDSEGEVRIWLEGKSAAYRWEPFDNYQAEFDAPLWKAQGETARQAGHEGADYFTLGEFVRAVREKRPSPVNVYDAVAWSAVIPLSAESVRAGFQPVEIPDFTTGRM